jgi:hypothetical protein
MSSFLDVVFALRMMLPAAGGQAPLVVIFNTGLLVLAAVQLILVISLGQCQRRYSIKFLYISPIFLKTETLSYLKQLEWGYCSDQ